MSAVSSQAVEAPDTGLRHRLWVRFSHWTGAVSFLALAFSGFMILMAHPRLYWGDVGNDLTPALLEFPINDNHRPDQWERTVTFSELTGAPFSANRTYSIFNQNGWARSLHFLAAWVLVVTGLAYLVAGAITGHFVRRVLPGSYDLKPRNLLLDFAAHLRLKLEPVSSGRAYGPLQRWAYALIVLALIPFMVLTGMSMSPAIAAAYPFLQDLFGGHQSARTLHFFGFAALVLFLLTHVVMVGLTGFRRQMRAMIMGQ